MTFLPIVDRELRVAARRRGTFWSRLIAAIVGVGAGVWILLANSEESPQELGETLFGTLAVLIFIYAIFVGTQVTSDSLSEEKREGTLGLLFLTDLKGYDVVFGKLVASSINAAYGMLAVMPILAVPLLLGGVTNAEFWRIVLVCGNLLFFTLAAGIFSSAVSQKEMHALGLASLLTLGLIIVPPVVRNLLDWNVNSGAFDPLFLFGPAYACIHGFETNFNARQFWMNMGITQIYAWTFLVMACRIVPRSWQDTNAARARGSLWRRFLLGLEGGEKGRIVTRRKLLSLNPYLWRAGRSRVKMMWVWSTLVLAGLIRWGWHVLEKNYDHWEDPGSFIVIAIGLHLLLKIWLTFAATSAMSEDRRNGGMELLLTTPLRENEIVRGMRLALWRQFAGPVLTILALDFALILVSGVEYERRFWLTWYLTIGGFLAIDLLALSWVGPWQGLAGRGTNRSAMFALFKVIMLPSIIFVVGLTCASAISNSWITWKISLFFWCVFGLAADVFFASRARRNLAERFRDVVTQSIVSKKSK